MSFENDKASTHGLFLFRLTSTLPLVILDPERCL